DGATAIPDDEAAPQSQDTPGVLPVEVDMYHARITISKPVIQNGRTRNSPIRLPVVWLTCLGLVLVGISSKALVYSFPLDPQDKHKAAPPLPVMKKMQGMAKMGGAAPASNSQSPTEPKIAKERRPIDPTAVEVRLSDGSRVHMNILQGSLEIETKYG